MEKSLRSKTQSHVATKLILPGGDIVDLEKVATSELPPIVREYVQKSLGKGRETIPYDRFQEILTRQRLIISSAPISRGHHLFLARGELLRQLIFDLVEIFMRPLQPIRLGLPPVFDLPEDQTHPVFDLIHKFQDKLFHIEGLTRSALQYASDPLLFQWFSNTCLPATILPLTIYSPGTFFRMEQTGELRGILRSRSLNIPDYHRFATDGLDAFLEAHRCTVRVMDLLCGQDGWLLVQDCWIQFFDQFQDRLWPALAGPEEKMRYVIVRLLRDQTHYYSLQHQYVRPLLLGYGTQVGNLQWDQTNARRFNIQWRSEKSNAVSPCDIIHGTLVGRIEKVFAVLTDIALRAQAENKVPSFPLWLSPVQLRIMPVKPVHLSAIQNQLKALTTMHVRLDVDDREIPLRDRIRQAEQEWIPYVVVIGDREVADDNVTPRVRGGHVSPNRRLPLQALADWIVRQQDTLPFRPLPLPIYLSRRVGIEELI